MTKQKIAFLVISLFLMCVTPVMAQDATTQKAQTETIAAALDTSAIDTTSLLLDEAAMEMDDSTAVADGGAYTQLKKKFVDGGVWFMSLVALCLILGLAFCIERIIYLTLSEIDAKKFMVRLEEKLKTEGVEAAKDLCRNTRGPIASICYQGLLRIDSSMEEIERSVSSYASVQVGKMEKGCSWITLFIAMAPSLGFLGTVIGMVMAFDQIEIAGDIGPTIVASGMKVALITTIFGIIVALILQLFYNYVLSKIDHLTAQMEESAITLMDIIKSYGGKKG
ncbi:MAG: MotA/TolQ/ExbB proton channel family protein [Prevotella sp.]|nr:MotA/TolQ/ExbB proton channel family protein [Prevotella sp.]